tara:strand:- start:540 stop:938 length:399 start_codon:yes stop_codon:yes gene_type:complete
MVIHSRITLMPQKQNIVMVQNNNGCGCGTLIGIIVLIGMTGYLLEEHGPIVLAVVGFFLGAWGGLKVSGVSIEELNAIASEEYDSRQIRGIVFMIAGAILFAIAGWGMGAELIREMEDNKQALQRLANHLIT